MDRDRSSRDRNTFGILLTHIPPTPKFSAKERPQAWSKGGCDALVRLPCSFLELPGRTYIVFYTKYVARIVKRPTSCLVGKSVPPSAEEGQCWQMSPLSSLRVILDFKMELSVLSRKRHQVGPSSFTVLSWGVVLEYGW
jgi:hypothetical protein